MNIDPKLGFCYPAAAMFKAVESVTQGHPDKVCDQIADAIVDEYLRRDKNAHVDINVLGSHGMMMIGGEIHSTADFDIGALAQKVYQEIGYQDDLEVFVNVEDQSEEMKRVVKGARDTVVVHGYATNETRELVPRPVVYAHALARRLDDLRRTDPLFRWLKPDGKVQIIMEGDRVCAVTILASHHLNVKEKEVQTALLERVVLPIIGEEGVQIYINPIGSFTICGFRADAGANGRKQAVDTYGGLIPHGDSAFSGKDPRCASRAGAYMARFVARALVEQGLASALLLHVVYTLGREEPIRIQAVGMGEKSRGAKMDLTNLVKETFDFRLEAIVEQLDLLVPIYRSTAVYGHFGRTGFPWEASGE